jgi:RNA polymerase sigma-70 factor (ECF subfamily)
MDVDDAELLSRWAIGDKAAGGELVRRYFLVVHRFFRNKVAGDIEDLVQSTFVAGLEAHGRFRQESTFKTYLLGIAHNQLLAHFRNIAKQEVVDFSSLSIQDLSTSPTGALARREEERLLVHALQRIPLELQVVLELVYWEALDGPEIATILEIPLNTVYSRLRRARTLLGKVLHELVPTQSGSFSTCEDLDSWALRIARGHAGARQH